MILQIVVIGLALACTIVTFMIWRTIKQVEEAYSSTLDMWPRSLARARKLMRGEVNGPDDHNHTQPG